MVAMKTFILTKCRCTYQTARCHIQENGYLQYYAHRQGSNKLLLALARTSGRPAATCMGRGWCRQITKTWIVIAGLGAAVRCQFCSNASYLHVFGLNPEVESLKLISKCQLDQFGSCDNNSNRQQGNR